MVFGRRKIPDETGLEIDGRNIVVKVRRSSRSRRFRLSISLTGTPVLSLPPNGNWADAEGFLRQQRAWLETRLQRTPKPVPFADGARIPFRGEPALIAGTGRLRGRVELCEQAEGLVLRVPGAPAHLARRLTDWLKTEALGDLDKRAGFHAGRLGVDAKSVRTRNQSSRWGSCSSTGRLNFNWRLILAPPFVLDYVAAHEVAHLCEMNHSPAFWSRVQQTLPDMKRGRAWLRANGGQLMVYGLEVKSEK